MIGVGSIHAGEKPLSAFEVLKLARHQIGNRVGANLLSMESENAKLQPRYWWIRFYDDQLFLKVRSVQMIGPDMIHNVEPGNPFDGGDSGYIIQPSQLKYDSDRCIAFIEKAAKESNIPLHSLNVRLEKPYPGESNSIWYFEWLDEQERVLGTLNISAATGRVTEIVGLKIKNKKFQGVSKKTISESVKETFLEVGADIGEFFNGKSSADKEENKK